MKSKTKKLEKLTEKDNDDIARKMLKVALEAFGQFPEKTEDEDQDEIARRVVRVIATTETMRREERRRFSSGEYLDIETIDVVATAFWMWSEKVDLDISDVSPCSVIGCRYLGFAQGLAAARAMSEAMDTMSEAMDMLTDGSMFAFGADGAMELVDKIPAC